MPALIREDFCIDTVDGEVYTYCSETCRWTHKVAFADEYNGRKTPAMGRFSGRRQWEEVYHGWDLADCMKDLGFLRPDGHTLIQQPHLHMEDDKLWTLDHVKGFEVQSPLINLRKLSPEEQQAHVEEYRKGFTCKPI